MLGGESDKMAVDRPAGSAIVKGLMIAECSGAFFLGAKPRDIRNVFPAVEWSSSAAADVHGVCWTRVEAANMTTVFTASQRLKLCLKNRLLY